MQDTLYSVDYALAGEAAETITIATVRPETILGDSASPSTPTTTATAVSSAATAILPLVGRRLPIIADDYVKVDFGTGALKITPGHDPNDFEIGRAPRARGDLGRSARTGA